MDRVNETLCAIGLAREKHGWSWEAATAELYTRTGVKLEGEAMRSRWRYWRAEYLRENYGIEEEQQHRNVGEGIRWEEGPNNLRVGYTGSLISSLPELKAHLAEHGVDLDKWVVKDWEAKAYPVYCANRQVDLDIEAGRMTGTIYSDGDLTIKQVFSIHAEFVPKEPVVVRPVLVPVVLSQPGAGEIQRVVGDTERWLAAGDMHIGYKEKGPERRLVPLQDRRAMELFVQACALSSPDGVIIGGDLLDLAEWSTHYVRAPHCVKMTQPALIEGLYWLARIRAVVGWGVPVVYIEGNHELRIRTYLHKHVAHAADLRGVTIEAVSLDASEIEPALNIQKQRAIGLAAWLSLDDLEIEWVEGYPDSLYWLPGPIEVKHGERALSPGNTAKEQSKQSAVHTVFFHIHRRERVTHTVYDRGPNQEVTSICPGGLMRTDGSLPGSKKRDQWQQGFLEIAFAPDDGIPPHFDTVAIHEGRMLYAGQLLEGTPMQSLSFLRTHFPMYNWGDNED